MKTRKMNSIQPLIEKKELAIKHSNNNDYIFLKSYILCEVVIKRLLNWQRRLQGEKNKDFKSWKVTSLKKALENYSKIFDIDYSMNNIDILFNYNINKNARELRNNVAHSLHNKGKYIGDKDLRFYLKEINRFLSIFQ